MNGTIKQNHQNLRHDSKIMHLSNFSELSDHELERLVDGWESSSPGQPGNGGNTSGNICNNNNQ